MPANACSTWTTAPGTPPAASTAGGIYTDTPYRRDGAFYQNSIINFAQVTDGLSNTAAVGERFAVLTNPTLYPEQQDEYGTWCLGTNLAENHSETSLGSIGIPFNYDGETGGSYIRFAASNTAGAFRSMHTGGLNFLLLDGSVHFLSVNTPDAMRLALGTIAGRRRSLARPLEYFQFLSCRVGTAHHAPGKS